MKIAIWMVVVGLLFSACDWLDRAMASNELAECPDLLKQDLLTPHDEAIRTFHTLDLGDQFQVVICGSQYVHPPVLEFESAFAGGGERVAEFLVAQLASGVDDLTFRDVVNVFSRMQRQGTYDVGTEKLFLQWLEARGEAMTNNGWREYAIEVIHELQRE